jgi:hypothetical protein
VSNVPLIWVRSIIASLAWEDRPSVGAHTGLGKFDVLEESIFLMHETAWVGSMVVG